jgi:hypothetical protein
VTLVTVLVQELVVLPFSFSGVFITPFHPTRSLNIVQCRPALYIPPGFPQIRTTLVKNLEYSEIRATVPSV